MAVSTRFGGDVQVLRYATAEDVKRLDPPCDKEMKQKIANKSLVVATIDGGPEQVHALWNLCADGGLSEILNSFPEGRANAE